MPKTAQITHFETLSLVGLNDQSFFVPMPVAREMERLQVELERSDEIILQAWILITRVEGEIKRNQGC